MRLIEPPDEDSLDAETSAAIRPQVEMTLAVEEDLLVLARLGASTVASRAGFDIEEIDDLRLAVDELCLHVLRGRRTGRLLLTFAAGAGRIDVWCNYDGVDVPREVSEDDGVTSEISSCILDALVDEHRPSRLDGLPGTHIYKRARSDG